MTPVTADAPLCSGDSEHQTLQLRGGGYDTQYYQRALAHRLRRVQGSPNLGGH